MTDTYADNTVTTRIPRQLRESDTHGKGAAEIGWGTPGDFKRCQLFMRRHGVPGHEIDGACANLHKLATGEWPGKNAHKGHLATAAVISLTAAMGDYTPIRWEGPLAHIEKPTGDRRRFPRDTLTYQSFPQPFRWQKQGLPGHTGAITVGVIEHAEEKDVDKDLATEYNIAPGRYAWGRGYFLDPNVIPEVNEAVHQVEHGVSGPSVDLDSYTAVLKKNALSGETTADMVRGRQRAATLVSVPAFADLRIKITRPDDAITASMEEFAVNAGGWRNAPIAPREATFDADDAAKRIEAWANGDPNKMAQLFLWVDTESGPLLGRKGYRLPWGDIIDNKPYLIYHAIYAAAALLQDAHGGLPNIPDQQKGHLRTIISEIYQKLAEEFNDPSMMAPWDRGDVQQQDQQQASATGVETFLGRYTEHKHPRWPGKPGGRANRTPNPKGGEWTDVPKHDAHGRIKVGNKWVYPPKKGEKGASNPEAAVKAIAKRGGGSSDGKHHETRVVKKAKAKPEHKAAAEKKPEPRKAAPEPKKAKAPESPTLTHEEEQALHEEKARLGRMNSIDRKAKTPPEEHIKERTRRIGQINRRLKKHYDERNRRQEAERQAKAAKPEAKAPETPEDAVKQATKHWEEMKRKHGLTSPEALEARTQMLEAERRLADKQHGPRTAPPEPTERERRILARKAGSTSRPGDAKRYNEKNPVKPEAKKTPNPRDFGNFPLTQDLLWKRREEDRPRGPRALDPDNIQPGQVFPIGPTRWATVTRGKGTTRRESNSIQIIEGGTKREYSYHGAREDIQRYAAEHKWREAGGSEAGWRAQEKGGKPEPEKPEPVDLIERRQKLKRRISDMQENEEDDGPEFEGLMAELEAVEAKIHEEKVKKHNEERDRRQVGAQEHADFIKNAKWEQHAEVQDRLSGMNRDELKDVAGRLGVDHKDSDTAAHLREEIRLWHSSKTYKEKEGHKAPEPEKPEAPKATRPHKVSAAQGRFLEQFRDNDTIEADENNATVKVLEREGYIEKTGRKKAPAAPKAPAAKKTAAKKTTPAKKATPKAPEGDGEGGGEGDGDGGGTPVAKKEPVAKKAAPKKTTVAKKTPARQKTLHEYRLTNKGREHLGMKEGEKPKEPEKPEAPEGPAKTTITERISLRMVRDRVAHGYPVNDPSLNPEQRKTMESLGKRGLMVQAVHGRQKRWHLTEAGRQALGGFEHEEPKGPPPAPKEPVKRVTTVAKKTGEPKGFKPNPAQQKALEEIRDHSGPDDHARVHPATKRVLEREGYIDSEGKLTQKGRDHLGIKEPEAKKEPGRVTDALEKLKGAKTQEEADDIIKDLDEDELAQVVEGRGIKNVFHFDRSDKKKGYRDAIKNSVEKPGDFAARKHREKMEAKKAEPKPEPPKAPEPVKKVTTVAKKTPEPKPEPPKEPEKPLPKLTKSQEENLIFLADGGSGRLANTRASKSLYHKGLIDAKYKVTPEGHRVAAALRAKRKLAEPQPKQGPPKVSPPGSGKSPRTMPELPKLPEHERTSGPLRAKTMSQRERDLEAAERNLRRAEANHEEWTKSWEHGLERAKATGADPRTIAYYENSLAESKNVVRKLRAHVEQIKSRPHEPGYDTPREVPGSRVGIPSEEEVRARTRAVTLDAPAKFQAAFRAQLEHQGRIAPRSLVSLGMVSETPRRHDDSSWGKTTNAEYFFVGDHNATNFSPRWQKEPGEMHATQQLAYDTGWYSHVEDGTDSIEATLAHEFGHHIGFRALAHDRNGELLKAIVDEYDLGVEPTLGDVRAAIKAQARKLALELSEYSITNLDEFLAEIWREFSLGGARTRPKTRRIALLMRELSEEGRV